MKETRRLDILAAIGGVLAVVLLICVGIAGYRWQASNHFDEYWAREALLKNAKQPEMRADLEVMLDVPTLGFRPDINKLRKAVEKYPNNPRLNLHLAVMSKEPLATQALRHVMELDPDNALPFYLLASKAASRGEWDDALALLAKGNALKEMDFYDFPFEIARGDFTQEFQISHADSNAAKPAHSALRKLAMSARDHALRLNEQGNSSKALAILAEMRKMGWRYVTIENADIFDVLRGSNIVSLSNQAVERIATGTNGTGELARVKAETERLAYLRAGTRSFVESLADQTMDRTGRFLCLGMTIPWTLAMASAWMLGGLISFAVYARKSKGVPNSQLHLEAAKDVYSGRRLLRVYAVVLIASCLSSTLLLLARHDLAFLTFVPILLGWMTPFGVTMAVDIWLSKAHRKTCSRLAEQAGNQPLPKFPKMSALDKREVARREAGLQGGFILALLIWTLMVSMVTKVGWDIYPWQLGKAMGGMPQAEMRYVKDLIAGKVKVPQKYIDQIKREEARVNVQRSTLNSQRSTKPGGRE